MEVSEVGFQRYACIERTHTRRLRGPARIVHPMRASVVRRSAVEIRSQVQRQEWVSTASKRAKLVVVVGGYVFRNVLPGTEGQVINRRYWLAVGNSLQRLACAVIVPREDDVLVRIISFGVYISPNLEPACGDTRSAREFSRHAVDRTLHPTDDVQALPVPIGGKRGNFIAQLDLPGEVSVADKGLLRGASIVHVGRDTCCQRTGSGIFIFGVEHSPIAPEAMARVFRVIGDARCDESASQIRERIELSRGQAAVETEPKIHFSRAIDPRDGARPPSRGVFWWCRARPHAHIFAAGATGNTPLHHKRVISPDQIASSCCMNRVRFVRHARHVHIGGGLWAVDYYRAVVIRAVDYRAVAPAPAPAAGRHCHRDQGSCCKRRHVSLG